MASLCTAEFQLPSCESPSSPGEIQIMCLNLSHAATNFLHFYPPCTCSFSLFFFAEIFSARSAALVVLPDERVPASSVLAATTTTTPNRLRCLSPRARLPSANRSISVPPITRPAHSPFSLPRPRLTLPSTQKLPPSRSLAPSPNADRRPSIPLSSHASCFSFPRTSQGQVRMLVPMLV